MKINVYRLKGVFTYCLIHKQFWIGTARVLHLCTFSIWSMVKCYKSTTSSFTTSHSEMTCNIRFRFCVCPIACIILLVKSAGVIQSFYYKNWKSCKIYKKIKIIKPHCTYHIEHWSQCFLELCDSIPCPFIWNCITLILMKIYFGKLYLFKGFSLA